MADFNDLLYVSDSNDDKNKHVDSRFKLIFLGGYMINFMEVRYMDLTTSDANQLFSARKKTFKDRLDWRVDIANNMEVDAYDNISANYILGKCNDVLICSVRLIDTAQKNMLNDGVFNDFFDDKINLNGNSLEASRLFIDKEKITKLSLSKHPICSILFRSMVTYARKRNYNCMYAVVSQQMYIIFRRAGWDVEILARGQSEKRQIIYYILMPIDKYSVSRLLERTSIPELIHGDNNSSRLMSFPRRWYDNI